MDRRRILLIVAAIVAALGLVLVFLYARGADARADERYDAVEVYKAVQPITLGETFETALGEGKIEQQSVPRGQLLEGYVTVDNAESLTGQLAAMDIAPGEQITSAKFAEEVTTGVRLPVPEGLFAVSVQLSDPQRVAGFVNPGDAVTVISTTPDTGGLATVLIPDAQVIGVGSSTPLAAPTTEDGQPAPEGVSNTILTLAVPLDDSLRLAYASESGTLSFALRGEGVEVQRGDQITSGDLYATTD